MAKTHPTSKMRKRRLRIQRAIYSILVTLAVFVILYYLIVRPSGDTSIVENGLGTVFTPIQRGMTAVTGFIRSWFGISSSEADKDQTIAELQMEVERLNIQLNSYAEIESENQRLQVLLNAQDEYDALSPVYAKVIAKDTGVWFDSFTINRGQNDGIMTNMAVVNGSGLVGRVYEVGYNYAKVLSIIDPRSSVATLVGRTRDNGMLQGETQSNSDSAECYMYYLPNIGNVKIGDSIYTSGLDSRFPKGLYVGTVTAISRSQETADKYVVVSPAVQFSSIEEVFVLREQVETAGESLPAVPTATPKPIVTIKPTATSNIYSYETPRAVDDNAIWVMPTATPSVTAVPETTKAPGSDKPIPEASWLEN